MENVSSRCGKSDNAPRLRFPEFSGEWEEKKLGEIAERVTRKNRNNETDLPLTISSKDGLVDQVTYFNKTVASKDMSGYYLLKNGEFAYNKSYSVGYDFGSIKRLDKYPMGALSTLYICFSIKNFDSDFMKVYFDSLKWYREIYLIAAEGARNHGLLNISTEDFFETKHKLPLGLPEQERIAAFFTLLDRRIQKQRQLVEYLKTYKRGVIFSIFKEDNPFGIQIKKTPLSELLTEYRNRNTENLMVCSVAVGKGVVNQIEHLGRSFAAADTSNYGKVKPGDIVYTKSPTGNFPYGIVKQSRQKQDVAVSPLYGVYTPKSFSTGTLIHNYFEQSENANNYIRPLAQKGAKNTINITTSYFLQGSIPFPVTEDDVEKLANFFNLIDEKIQQTEIFLQNLSMQKKELLHRMFI